jgi:hypothetical protein
MSTVTGELTCPHCDYKSTRQYNVNRHMVRKHTVQNVQNVCSTVQNVSSLSKHMCTKCHKDFIYNCRLLRHTKTCKGSIDSTSCPYCNKVLANRSSKCQHLKTCKVKLEKDAQALVPVTTTDTQSSACSFIEQMDNNTITKRRKVTASLKKNIWLKCNGTQFESKCHIAWCKNIITPFSFEAGHNIPHSKGGDISIDNLFPICGCCNKSMGNKYTIDEYSRAFASIIHDDNLHINNKTNNVNGNNVLTRSKCNTCMLCERVFSRKYILTNHMKKCTGPKCALECDYCHKTFAHRSNKYAHVRICSVKKEIDSNGGNVVLTTENVVVPSLTCSRCSKSFKANWLLNKHTKSCFNKISANVCGYCNKTFSDRFCKSRHHKICKVRLEKDAQALVVFQPQDPAETTQVPTVQPLIHK